MCVIKSDKTKCMVIALLSIVTHTIILCVLIGSLVLRIKNAYQESKPSNLSYTHGNVEENKIYALIGITMAFCLLGITASITLIIGIKYKKPGCLAIFLCYITLATILLLISALLLLLLGGRWKFALAASIMAGHGFSSFAKVHTTYEAMSEESSISTHNNSISNVAILTEEFNDDSDESFKTSVYSVE